MRNAAERRQLILKYLVEYHFATRVILSKEFCVSKRTIERDILCLSCSYPITTHQGGGGGIYISKRFKLGDRYLTDEQCALLERLALLIEGTDLLILKSILKRFRRPQR